MEWSNCMCSCVFSDTSFHVAAGKGISDWAARAASYSHTQLFFLSYLFVSLFLYSFLHVFFCPPGVRHVRPASEPD